MVELSAAHSFSNMELRYVDAGGDLYQIMGGVDITDAVIDANRSNNYKYHFWWAWNPQFAPGTETSLHIETRMENGKRVTRKTLGASRWIDRDVGVTTTNIRLTRRHSARSSPQSAARSWQRHRGLESGQTLWPVGPINSRTGFCGSARLMETGGQSVCPARDRVAGCVLGVCCLRAFPLLTLSSRRRFSAGIAHSSAAAGGMRADGLAGRRCSHRGDS